MEGEIEMRRILTSGLPILVFLAAGFAARGQCVPGGLAVIVNTANPTESLSVSQLRKLILGDVRTWPDKKAVVLVSRETSSELFKCVLSSIVRMSDAEYNRYIVGAEFRGADPLAVKTVNSDAGAGKIVASIPGSLMVVDARDLPGFGASVRIVKVSALAGH